MPSFLKDYGTTEGPLGFPMKDEHAQALEQVLKDLPKTDEYVYRKAVSPNAIKEINPGERSDVSWISTESPDRMGEVVLARGMNSSQFAKNPLVTIQHDYYAPPIGKSLWQKRAKDGDLIGVKAKTKYPPRPDDWPKDADGKEAPWPPDKVFSLVKADILLGKSIGFLPLKAHVPDTKEYKANGWEENSVQRVFDEWLLLEYAVCFMPCNQDALVEAVGKGIDIPLDLRRALGLDDALFTRPKQAPPPAVVEKAVEPPPAREKVISFVSMDQIEAAVTRSLGLIDYAAIIERAISEGFDRARGRV